MWKVLIVDDEAIIREGIRESINWNEFDMEVVAEAEDGEEALELAIKHEVHVLFVDLSMPIMDGLTLIRHVRERLPYCRMVVITGHDEFSYAQEALRLQVDDYLLKPTDPKQLREVVAKVKEKLERQQKEKRYMELLTNQVRKNAQLLRQQLGVEWVAGRLREEEMMRQLPLLDLPSSCPVQVVVIQWFSFKHQPIMSDRDRHLLLFAIENVVSELLMNHETMVFHDPNGLVVVMVWTPISEEQCKGIEAALKQYLYIGANAYIEMVEGGMAGVIPAYEKCRRQMAEESRLSPVVRRAKQYIQKHFSQSELTLESVAQFLNVSPVYLSRMIKQELGISFVHLLTKLRMTKAVELLLSTELSIHEIAEQVGYDTQHYFSTAFKKVMGVSPNQYRKMHVQRGT
ncbi:response regulator [Geobacillus sp. MMMUD3]|uniref:response regulator transcription factor n=1 Tax=Geobacillus subterraneus TaxID=129338 RepID=UPI00155DFA53|nr:response regulator [Geobacillus subterraneus]NNV07600.1 response regulator [Geobacillus sp. MMMUD3]WPZ16931.1 response regulator [Geobacillus subterraneus]